MDKETKAANHSIHSIFSYILDTAYFDDFKFDRMLSESVKNYALFLTLQEIDYDDLDVDEKANKFYSDKIVELKRDYSKLICKEYSMLYNIKLKKNDINLIPDKKELKKCIKSLIKKNNYIVNEWDMQDIFHQINDPLIGQKVTNEHVYNNFLNNLHMVDENINLSEILSDSASWMAGYFARFEVNKQNDIFDDGFLNYEIARNDAFDSFKDNIMDHIQNKICEAYWDMYKIKLQDNNINSIKDIGKLKKCLEVMRGKIHSCDENSM